MFQPGLPRCLEIGSASVGLLLVAPVLLVCAFLVRLTSRGPILFCQQRIGLGGEPFKLYKLRTMRVAKGSLITAASDPRITGVGRVLRKTKLDELPELWNVIRGDMSFVGPRPEVPEYVNLDDPLWQEVLQVKPGMTDPVTLKLIDEGSLLEKVEDKDGFYRTVLQPFKLRSCITYLENRSPSSDLSVIAQTFLVLSHRRVKTSEDEILLDVSAQNVNRSIQAQANAS